MCNVHQLNAFQVTHNLSICLNDNANFKMETKKKERKMICAQFSSVG